MVTVTHRAGTTTGHLTSWDERGCVVDGQRISGPVMVVPVRRNALTEWRQESAS